MTTVKWTFLKIKFAEIIKIKHHNSKKCKISSLGFSCFISCVLVVIFRTVSAIQVWGSASLTVCQTCITILVLYL
jgi:uncharacterized UBP type Zn finger protein